MPEVIAKQKWIELPSRLYVAAQRMLGEDGKIFTLHRAATMEVEAFNQKANRYDVNISHGDRL